jgi:hypothetical protein
MAGGYSIFNLSAPFDKPFGKLAVPSDVEGLTALNNVEGLRPPLLRVMQNIGHCMISPLKRDPCRTWSKYYMQNSKRKSIIKMIIKRYNYA